jgi:hypothetical protein
MCASALRNSISVNSPAEMPALRSPMRTSRIAARRTHNQSSRLLRHYLHRRDSALACPNSHIYYSMFTRSFQISTWQPPAQPASSGASAEDLQESHTIAPISVITACCPHTQIGSGNFESPHHYRYSSQKTVKVDM